MDAHSKLDRAQDELWCMEDAMSALQDVPGMDHVKDIIKGAMIVKGFEIDQLHKLVEEQDAREAKELKRDYLRSVI